MPSMPRGAQRASAISPDLAPAVSGRRAALRRHLARGSLAGLALMLVAPGGAASAHGTDTDSERLGAATTFRPGALVSDHGVSVVAPRAGGSVWSEIHFDDGSVQVLQVETHPDGQVYVRYMGDERPSRAPQPMSRELDVRDAQLGATGLVATAPTGPAAAAPTIGATATASTTSASDCSGTSYYLYSWRMPSYKWYYQSGSTPSSLSWTATADSIKRANTDIVTARNGCGRGDHVSATFSYLGTTSRGTNIASYAGCPGGDGYSVIGFGSLPSGVLGMTCVYGVSSGYAHEADVRLNRYRRWSNYQSSCSSATLVESLMTHELGHVYGLGHVYTSSLTMNSYVPNCSLAPATLGLGDMYGLERKY